MSLPHDKMAKPPVVYPGSFDPLTYGHLDVIERGVGIFGELTVAIVVNPRKDRLFPLEERRAMLLEATAHFGNAVTVDAFEGLLVHYMEQKKASVVLRGLRALSDFDYEFEMALANREMAPTIETIFMMSSQEHIFLRASLVKEISRLGGRISHYVPPCVERRLNEYFHRDGSATVGLSPLK